MNITIIPNTFPYRYSDLEDFGKKINELSQPLADEESQETVLISGDDEKVGEGTSAEGTVFKVQHRLLFQNGSYVCLLFSLLITKRKKTYNFTYI
jgi:hypothetical protein